MNLLIDDGINLEIYGRGAMERACIGKNLAAFQRLIECGISAKDLTVSDEPVINYLCGLRCPVSMIKAVVAAGADVNLCYDGFYAIHHAAFYYPIEMVEFLVQNGADMNAKDNDGWSFLHHAAQKNTVNFFKTCLEAGFDLNVRNNAGQTPLFIAIKNDNSQVTNFLTAHNMKIFVADENEEEIKNSKFSQFSQELGELIVKFMLNNGFNFMMQKYENSFTISCENQDLQSKCCSICKKDGWDYSSRCGHNFHKRCLKSHLKSRPSKCPNCREIIFREKCYEDILTKAKLAGHDPLAIFDLSIFLIAIDSDTKILSLLKWP